MNPYYYRNPDECPDCGMSPCACDYAENPDDVCPGCGMEECECYADNPSCPVCGQEDCDCEYEGNPDDWDDDDDDDYEDNPDDWDDDDDDDYEDNPDDWDDDDDDDYDDNPDDGYMHNPCEECGMDPCTCEHNPDDGYMRNPWNSSLRESSEDKLSDAVEAIEQTLQQASQNRTNLSLLFDIAHDLGVLRASYSQAVGEEDAEIVERANAAIGAADAHLSAALKSMQLTEESEAQLEEKIETLAGAAMPWKRRRGNPYY